MSTSIIDYVFRELAISYLGRTDLSHVAEEDPRGDTLGAKMVQSTVGSRLEPPAPAFELPAAPPVTGRAAMPVSGGSGGLAQAKALSASEMARLKGYEGDSCGDCGQFTMARNGTCLKCITCGTTTGCS